MAQYCTACGSALDAEGVCTNKNCPRRALQQRQAESKAASETAIKEAERARLERRAQNRKEFLGAQSALRQTLAINADWQ